MALQGVQVRHEHRFLRYALLDDRNFPSEQVFGASTRGWYIGYECRCGEQGYAIA